MSQKLILYEFAAGSPVRAVKILAEALKIELDLKNIDLFSKQQFSDEFLQISPNHTVPVLDDNGFFVRDSHAIMIYIVEKYANNDYFYPKDITKKSLINELLFLDTSIFEKYVGIMKPIFYDNVKGITKSQIASLEDSYKSVERILGGKRYVTGDHVTIADFSLVTTLTCLNLIASIAGEEYPNITSWIKRMEQLPYYQPNAIGIEVQRAIIEDFLK